MSLNFKLPAPHERFYRVSEEDQPYRGIAKGDRYLDPDVESCILWTASTGIGPLKTEADAVEHWVRAKFARGGEEAFPLSIALSLVGLWVNVTRETEASFTRRISKLRMQDLRWDARKAAEKLQKKAS